MAVEEFDDGALIFLPDECRLIQANLVVRDILARMDGKTKTQNIIYDTAKDYGASFDTMYQDVAVVLMDLTMQVVIRDVGELEKIKGFRLMDNVKYSINHDVSCRIEDPDGAILFNPENDAVQVINPTGLAIWQALECPRGKRDVVEYLLDICDGVPAEQVVQDVDEFIDKLKSAGFVGEVVE